MFDNLIPLYLYLGYPIARPEHLYDYVIAEQGIIKRLETWYVSAETLLAPIAERLIGLHLQTYPLRPLRLKVPRIPGQLLQEVLAEARRHLELELMVHFRFDAARGWHVTWPEQAQSRVRVGYSDPNQANIIVELHSHNTMPAYFSPTDDRDEQGGRFYAVMGHVDQPYPELTLRLGMYGHWLRNVPGLTLFDDLGPLVDIYDETAAEPSLFAYGDENETGWLSFANLFRRRSK